MATSTSTSTSTATPEFKHGVFDIQEIYINNSSNSNKKYVVIENPKISSIYIAAHSQDIIIDRNTQMLCEHKKQEYIHQLNDAFYNNEIGLIDKIEFYINDRNKISVFVYFSSLYDSENTNKLIDALMSNKRVKLFNFNNNKGKFIWIDKVINPINNDNIDKEYLKRASVLSVEQVAYFMQKSETDYKKQREDFIELVKQLRYKDSNKIIELFKKLNIYDIMMEDYNFTDETEIETTPAIKSEVKIEDEPAELVENSV